MINKLLFQRKHKLVSKIFFAFVSIIVLVIGLQLIIQEYFLTDIYTYTKIRQMENSFEGVLQELNMSNIAQVDTITGDFYKKHQTPVIVFDQNYRILNDSFFEEFSSLEIITQTKDLYIINTFEYVDELNDFIKPLEDLTIGDTIAVDVIKIPGVEEYLPIKLNNIQGSEISQQFKDQFHQRPFKISGKISQINKGYRLENILGYQKETLIAETLNIWEEDILNKVDEDEFFSYKYKEELSGIERIVLVGKYTIDNQIYYITALVTLENIADTFQILRAYYIYIGLFLLLTISCVAALLTQKITNPILQLNKTAQEIAHKNFKYRSNIKTNDELETLSESLNDIADRLSITIDDLENANNQLKLDALKKEKNEKRMRNMLLALSHEFKTPLGIISGFLEIIKDGVGDKEPDYYIKSMQEEVEHLNLLIQETLLLAQLESQSDTINLSKFSITKELYYLVDLFKQSFDKKNQEVHINADETIVIADQLKIRQVIKNLLSNANQYSPPNSQININITDKIKADEVGISISNEVFNIEQEDIEYFWDRFYRKESSRNKKSGGSGLGLAIVKQILVKHHSNYSIDLKDNRLNVYFTLKK